MTIKIKDCKYGLVLDVPYSASFVDDFKRAIHYSKRVWNSNKRGPARFPDAPLDVWIVDPTEMDTLRILIKDHFLSEPIFSMFASQVQAPTPKTGKDQFRMVWVGRSVMRDNGEHYASGLDYNAYINGNVKAWWYVFPLDVLQNFWDGTPLGTVQNKPNLALPRTLFQILGMPKPSTDQAEIKAAWRTQVKQWHPDYCKEPDAAERFHQVTEAYNKLSDPAKVDRYIKMLKLADKTPIAPTIKKQPKYAHLDEYVSPMRCGAIVMDYVESFGGKITATQIHSWKDIYNSQNETLAVNWGGDPDRPIDMLWIK